MIKDFLKGFTYSTSPNLNKLVLTNKEMKKVKIINSFDWTESAWVQSMRLI